MKNIDYKDYVIDAPLKKEGIEWAHNYAYNANDPSAPRVLMIGDSICNGYQWHVRQMLANRVNISFWVTSYCVTRECYFRMLDMILEDNRYNLVLFYSGHRSNPMPIWEEAYRSAIRFITDKLDGVKLALVNAAPARLDCINEDIDRRNAVFSKVAKELDLPLIDLWSPIAALGTGDDVFRDNAHFVSPVEQMQGRIISDAIASLLNLPEDGDVVQEGNETGPSGAIK